MSNLTIMTHSNSPFDSIRHIDDTNNEFWYARELMPLLGYAKWQHFKGVIENAKENVETITESVLDHFLPDGVKTQGRPKVEYKLSRLACYHIALSCDSRGNDQVKMAKHYFVVKTREAELAVSKPTLPTTYKEALLALVAEIDAKEKAEEACKLLEIENQGLIEDVEALSETVDELFSYSSIIRVAKFNNVCESTFTWRKLKATSEHMGIEIKHAPDSNWGKKNLYSHDVWRYVYPGFNLPETTTLVIRPQ